MPIFRFFGVEVDSDLTTQARRNWGSEGVLALQFLAKQLTLTQPGGRLYPPQYYEPPRIFRPCNRPVSYFLETILSSI